MNAPSRPLSSSALWFWVVSILLGGIFLWQHTSERLAVLDAYQRFSEPEAGQTVRRVFLDNDAYAWLRLSRAMEASGQWRMRHIDWENAPFGRENHWSSPPAWYLILLGKAWATLSGQPFDTAVEAGAVASQPLLLFLGTLLLSLLVARRWNFWAAGILSWGFIFSFQILWAFYAGRPDHQGFEILTCAGTFLCLLAGDLATVQDPRARRWFLASAVFGAFGLWIGASAMIPTLAACALAGLLAAWKRPDVQPRLWLHWGCAGAALSLLFYLVEYAPSFPIRFEVNNPLYALAWAAAGLCLSALAGRVRAHTPGAETPVRWAWVLGALYLAGCCFIFVRPPHGWSVLGEPLLWRMHRFIYEFEPFFSRFSVKDGLRFLLRDFGAFFVVGVYLLVAARKANGHTRRVIRCAFVPAAAFFAMTLWQCRWEAFASAFLVVAVSASGALFFHKTSRRGMAAVVFLVCCACAVGFWELGTARKLSQFTLYSPSLMQDAMIRDLAMKIGAKSAKPPVFLSSPGDALQLAYFSGGKAVPSFYWENLDGVCRAADIYSGTDEAQIRRLVKEAGVTHLVVFEPRNWLGEYVYYANGPSTLKTIQKSFGYRLYKEGRLPDWLRYIPYANPYPELRRVGAIPLVFEVVPERL